MNLGTGEARGWFRAKPKRREGAVPGVRFGNRTFSDQVHGERRVPTHCGHQRFGYAPFNGGGVGLVIKFNPQTQAYVQTGTSNAASIDVHARGEQFQIDFRWDGQRYLLAADRAGPVDSEQTVRVYASSIFEPVKHYWIPFIGSAAIVAALRPFIDAYSADEWRGKIAGVEDSRPSCGMTLEEALGPPSETALNKLVQESRSRSLSRKG